MSLQECAILLCKDLLLEMKRHRQEIHINVNHSLPNGKARKDNCCKHFQSLTIAESQLKKKTGKSYFSITITTTFENTWIDKNIKIT